MKFVSFYSRLNGWSGEVRPTSGLAIPNQWSSMTLENDSDHDGKFANGIEKCNLILDPVIPRQARLWVWLDIRWTSSRSIFHPNLILGCLCVAYEQQTCAHQPSKRYWISDYLLFWSCLVHGQCLRRTLRPQLLHLRTGVMYYPCHIAFMCNIRGVSEQQRFIRLTRTTELWTHKTRE